VAVLSTAGATPHAIPVSTAVRAGERRVLLALAPRRSSLARLRADPRVALTILAAGDVAVSAEGLARVVAEQLPGAEGVVAVVLEVESVQDHNQPTFAIEDGVRWRWTDPAAADRDAAVREALRALAARLD
jgi:Pyridoxamine 5'-phosphate oxidase